MNVIRDNFEVVTAKGAPIRQFDDLKRAAKWANGQVETFPGCVVLRVTVTVNEERETAYLPGVDEDDLDAPAMPELRRAS